LLATAPAARAEDPAAEGKQTVDEQVLEILRRQGTIDDQRYDELKRQAEEEQREREAKKEAEAKPDPEAWKVVFHDGLRFERNDGQYKFRVGGLLQFDFVGTGQQQELQDFVDNTGTGVDFRRARLTAEGDFGEHLYFKTEYDFAGGGDVGGGTGDADFTDLYVGLQRIPCLGRIQVGHFKEPMGLEELTSDRFTTFMERALPVLAFSPARNSGVAFLNTAFDQRLTWAVGGFRDVGSFGEGFEESSEYNTTARLSGLPLWMDDGETLVHLGASYSHRFRNEDAVAFAPKPEVNKSIPLVATGALDTEGIDVFGQEAALVIGPFSLQGEVYEALVNGEGAGRDDFWGAYGYASWFVTGERRNYDRKIGAFTRTSPKNPFSISKGQWGALELAARFSHVDLNEESVRGGVENDVTAGANWYLFSNLRLMVNWVYAHRNDIGNEHTGMARVSLDF
jgi:phosphate-selective porin OprO/OprP